MIPTNPFDSSMKLLTKVLDLRSERQKVIGSNIANAETPGYSPAKFEFENELKAAINSTGSFNLQTSHPSHIPLGPSSFDLVKGQITRTPDQTGIGDENGVSVDHEMIELSKNEMMYETAAKLLKKKMSLLKYAISDGK